MILRQLNTMRIPAALVCLLLVVVMPGCVSACARAGQAMEVPQSKPRTLLAGARKLQQDPATAALAVSVLALGYNVIKDVKNEIISMTSSDEDKRSTYVQRSLDLLGQQFPDYNVVVTCTEHSADPHEAFIHQHDELPLSLGRTGGYDIYYIHKGTAGTFTRLGDGGWIIWGFTCDDAHCKRSPENVITYF